MRSDKDKGQAVDELDSANEYVNVSRVLLDEQRLIGYREVCLIERFTGHHIYVGDMHNG